MPSAPESVSQDDHLIEPLPGGRIRLAVLDGVTPAADTPRLADLDGAASAAGILRTALRAGADVVQTAEQINTHLRVDHLPARHQPQTCAVICDLPAAPTAKSFTVTRFGDCEAWAKIGDGWTAVLHGGYRTEEGLNLVRQWASEHPEATLQEIVLADARLSADENLYVTTPVGRFPTLRGERTQITSDFDELVLASDGAQLSRKALADVEGWLRGLRDHERRSVPEISAKPHDDVTVIRVRRHQTPS